jgi:hypothetical protein
MDQLKDILVFKTNIDSEHDKERILAVLSDHDEIQEQNIDMQDVDRVLRVVSSSLTAKQIIAEINCRGFECTELE